MKFHPEKMLLTIHMTIEEMRVEIMGEEAMRVEIMGVEAMRVDIMGVEAMRVEIMGVEAMRVEIIKTMNKEIEMIRSVICATKTTMWPRKVHMERSLCNISHARTL